MIISKGVIKEVEAQDNGKQIKISQDAILVYLEMLFISAFVLRNITKSPVRMAEIRTGHLSITSSLGESYCYLKLIRCRLLVKIVLKSDDVSN
jgi:hypothetical protein